MGGTRVQKEENKRKILSACVRLFIEQGYSRTPPKQIFEEAGVTSGTFYNIFGSKSGVVTELTEFMFDNQFGIAGRIIGAEASPVLLYAVETSIQLTLAELNENLRDIYVEVYTWPESMELIRQKTTVQLQKIFGPYQPKLTASDFYELDIGTSGLMRAYMARPCDVYFTLEHKLRCFLQTTLRVFRVPEAELEQVSAFVVGLNIRAIADSVMQKLFQALEMQYDFTLDEPTKKEEPK